MTGNEEHVAETAKKVSHQMHEAFKESSEVKGIIETIPNIYKDQIAVELAMERFLFIIDQYQEQPHLLDPHLENLLKQLLDIVKDVAVVAPVKALAFRMLYLITKTRGYKVVVRLLPHEVADLEPVLAMLAEQSPSDHQNWEVRYMLLLWLSMVSMIPFDMNRLDSNLRQNDGQRRLPIMERIIQTAQSYVSSTDKSQDAAAYTLSRFFTRPDVQKKLPEFLDWCIVKMKDSSKSDLKSVTTLSGVLKTLALLMKYGKRDDLVQFGPTLLEHLSDMNLQDVKSNGILRKLAVKLMQRIGLIFLKAKVASWRYQRGSRLLTVSLSTLAQESATVAMGTGDEDEDYDIPDEMEEIIEFLLNGLKDRDTVVRWSAAKGIGRVTGRLPKELADDVLDSIMALFTISESDAGWHGGCLALAELGRRGLLVPARLPDVVPVVIKTLGYDEKRGNFSIGSHVRDAACYVCWAFARAYDPQEMLPHVQPVASALVKAFLFDREVNVRRAAAAAFQENVGRQGQFPHGIDIVTTCDYFAVGNRNTCFKELRHLNIYHRIVDVNLFLYFFSVFIGGFSEYCHSLIDHLVEIKLAHWDIEIRSLAADALHRLTPLASDHMRQKILPRTIELCTSIDQSQRHGALLATGDIEHHLEREAASSRFNSHLLREQLQGNALRGASGDLMRRALCSLVRNLSESKLPYHGDSIIDVWQNLIDKGLNDKDVDVQSAAVDALPSFCSEFYVDSSGHTLPAPQVAVVSKYIPCLEHRSEPIRIGHTQALGSLPGSMLKGQLSKVLKALIFATKTTKENTKMAAARTEAIRAISRVSRTVGIQPNGCDDDVMTVANLDRVYAALFEAMNDYTLDSRGDIGAAVREASMSALYELTSMLATSQNESLITPLRAERIFCLVVQQCCEKIDRTRAHMGEIFFELLYHRPSIPHIPHKEELEVIFPRAQLREECFNWGSPGSTFPLFSRLLSLSSYTYHVLLGMTVSVGGLTESLVKFSGSSLRSFLNDQVKTDEEIERFGEMLLKIFEDNQKQERVSLPMLKLIDSLFSGGCLDYFTEKEGHPFPVKLLTLCKTEVTKCGDVHRILASVDVFCDLLQFGGVVRSKSITHLMLFLCHRFPIVRKTSASKLYECMVTYDGLASDENLDEIMTILSETQWDEPVADVKPLRNKLCDLFDVPQPQPKAQPKATK
ncbi:hypothetical protein CAPTEDRAFT_167258 [Capitella teleta]|uniref:Tubulin-specific chaperone D n=1 Tax=Capitella teleta TaxID=283909 RepID=R7UHZ9_CAPTE|nr:hypothetical protein CAPTEDRAFT_167258 [Capitella teleta]|eukprot:ELU05840.1 hypothetical protein CAPTEDRAFT_167258 [Capitella teleta]